MANIFRYCALGALITLGTSCSKTPELDVSAASEKQIIATHAFDLSAPIIALSFVPNDVGPWLGRVIYVGADGKLFSTDIEGRAPKPVGTGTYTDVYGLLQVKLPGVFLALSGDSGDLSAFIESDFEGRFSPMTLSGADLSARSFCQTMDAQGSKIMILAADGAIATLGITVADKVAELTEAGRIKSPKGTTHCAFYANTIYALSSNKDNSSLHVYNEEKWQTMELSFTPRGFASVAIGGRPSLTVLGDEGMLLIDGENLNAAYHLTIADGLSIRGVASADFVSATSAPFGGAAFSEGVIVLSDTSTPRLVFISLGYMSGRLSAVQ